MSASDLLTRLADLQRLAERATPLYRHPVHVDNSAGQFSNVFSEAHIGRLVASFVGINHEANANYYIGADPAAILSLVAEIKAQLEWRPIESVDRTEPVMLFQEGHVYEGRWATESAIGPVWATPDGHMLLRPTHWKPKSTTPELA